MELSLVIPCYREEPHLEKNVDRVVAMFSILKIHYEIILVDDCSPDSTRKIIELLVQKYPNLVQGVYHEKNEGRGAAFMTGFTRARGKFAGFFDIDLEVSPVYTIDCFNRLRDQNADLVIGDRIYRVHLSLLHRHILSSCYSWLVHRLLELKLDLDTESGYKFFRSSALRNYVGKIKNKGWFWDTEVVSRFAWDGLNVIGVPCLFERNEKKISTVKPLQDSIEYFWNLIKFRRENLAAIRAAGRRRKIMVLPAPAKVDTSSGDKKKAA